MALPLGGSLSSRDVMMPTSKPDDEKRISLAPLDPEAALRALLAVKPDDPPEDDSDEKDDAPAE